MCGLKSTTAFTLNTEDPTLEPNSNDGTDRPDIA
jgi:hypothetical protein